MIEPPTGIVELAVAAAAESPCAKSKRGAAVYLPRTGYPITAPFHNGPPGELMCDGSDACRASCRYRCQHAEARAVHDLIYSFTGDHKDCDLVHVKVVDGELVAGGGPSCASCSGLILEVGIGGVWLYQEMPEEWCPHLDQRRTDCPLCQGEACDLCHPGYGRPHCEHDVIDRHHGHPLVEARWRRYDAAQFHRLSCIAAGVYLGR